MKSGFVCVAGSPSVGKSTIVNALVGEKVCIVSQKPGTTRNRINAILTLKDAQVVFVDTPGIHKPLHLMGNYMLKIAISALEGNDLILFVLSASKVGRSDIMVAQKLRDLKVPIFGVINKMDIANNAMVEKARDILKNLTDEIFEISALKGETNKLLDRIISFLPQGPKYYPDDIVTDRPLSFMISEIVREKIFELTREEIPYSTAVDIDQIEDEENLTRIYATILVAKDSQKGIILGKNGRMIRDIGTLARKDIEYLIDKHVFLSLHVKVKDKWIEDQKILNQIFGDELR
ncbi:GTPase Era [Athalassotoga saccharophila]|uniref:GTPase Era n=1 Tax=Athalassotoga saccharophila TaxID=1441386 RepID=UPI00137B38D7|nr:GTPase Era [Athalassotoga saccharophila]BBJ28885.1 GTPase Era [Athalassotoga saccharophila]